MAWILRFVNNISSLKNVKVVEEKLSVEEIDLAEKTIIKLAQNDSFDGSTDLRLRGLNVYLDERGLIRVKTVICNRADSQEFKFPSVLDPNHQFTKIFIHHVHERLKHAGVSTTMSSLRETVWILSSRRAVRSIISRCVFCRRYAAKTVNVPPASLPVNQVRDAAVFEVVGLDYAGPLYLRDGKKAWVCLFTCAVYRAVHLELVTSLSTAAFLESLRRFIARRGRPTTIYSDNGRNFVGACNLLKSVDWNKIGSYCSAEKIQWRFNPPSAPWWGGWWERLVRILKDFLRRSLGRASLCYEEMHTVLCECESVINTRPLMHLSEERDSFVAITPEMFLKEVRQDCTADLDYLDKISLSRRLRYIQRLREEVKKRFRVEYLGELTRYNRKKTKCCDIKEGQVVLIASDNQKRLDWPLALVLQVIPGNDGIPRIARLKIAAGELVRPLQRLVLLESSSADPNQKMEYAIDTDSNCSKTIHNAKKEDSRQDQQDYEKTTEHVIPQDQDSCREDPSPVINSQKRTRVGRIVKTPKRFSE